VIFLIFPKKVMTQFWKKGSKNGGKQTKSPKAIWETNNVKTFVQFSFP
jgi:hypothetical protein